jgi:hypothetical protein
VSKEPTTLTRGIYGSVPHIYLLQHESRG